MSKKRVISDLKASSERVGRLYPILVDKHGNVIDGMHRLAADESWPKMRLENVETEEQRLITRLISNACRRHVAAEEKTEMLGRLGEIYLSEGVEAGKIAYKIAEKTGMSYRWVAKYLSGRFKDSVKSEARVARRATEKDPRQREVGELTTPPKEKFLTVKEYANTHFVNVLLEKPFYKRLEKTAEMLGTTPDVLISNALLLTLKKLEGKERSRR